jgi:23S rRNA pseudouridine2605 synthase
MVAGRVSVNGSVVTELGVRVNPDGDVVTVDGERVGVAARRWVVFHKPPGVLTTRTDPHGGTTIYDVLPEGMHGLRYVGRLDRDAEGLLLLTNDGELANALAHPGGEVEREYWLEVAGQVDRDTVNRLTAGVDLDDGMARAVRARLLKVGDVSSRLTLVLTEGRKREVRRMLSAVGHPVMRLRRERFGPIRLGRLERGAWRDLRDDEIRTLTR